MPPEDLSKADSFPGILQASLRQIRKGKQPQARRIAGRIRSANLRTSGVSLLPQLESERNISANEAGVVTQLGSQQLGQNQTLERIQKRGDIRGRLQKDAFTRQRDNDQFNQRNQLRNALISGLFSGASSFLGRRGT